MNNYHLTLCMLLLIEQRGGGVTQLAKTRMSTLTDSECKVRSLWRLIYRYGG